MLKWWRRSRVNIFREFPYVCRGEILYKEPKEEHLIVAII